MFIPFERDTNTTVILTAADVFTPDECNRILAYGKAKEKLEATVAGDYGSELNKTIRKNTVAWLSANIDTELHFMYERLLTVAFTANNDTFNFDLYGITEDIQFTEYSELNDHYDMHMDTGSNIQVRKLSMVIQLSNPLDYTGSELEIYNSRAPAKIDKAQGSVSIFPSFMPHKVTPLLSGTRYSLVCWLGGPKFK